MPAGRRVLPQSMSTDPRYSRLSLKAKVLYPLLWVNADDQGRVSGNPDKIKLQVCASVPEIASEDIPGLIEEMAGAKNPGDAYGLIISYNTTKASAIQITDWWSVENPQWAWPSEYEPPPKWTDHLRYKRGRKEVVKINWPPYSRETSGENCSGPNCSASSLSGENSPEKGARAETPPPPEAVQDSRENSPERGAAAPLSLAEREAVPQSPELSGDRSPPKRKLKRKLKRNSNATQTQGSLRGETSSPRSTVKLKIYNKLYLASDSPKKQRRILVNFCRDYLCHPAGKDPRDLYGQVGRMLKLIPNPFELFSLAMLEVYERHNRGASLWDPMTFLWAVVNGRAAEKTSPGQGEARGPPH